MEHAWASGVLDVQKSLRTNGLVIDNVGSSLSIVDVGSSLSFSHWWNFVPFFFTTWLDSEVSLIFFFLEESLRAFRSCPPLSLRRWPFNKQALSGLDPTDVCNERQDRGPVLFKGTWNTLCQSRELSLSGAQAGKLFNKYSTTSWSLRNAEGNWAPTFHLGTQILSPSGQEWEEWGNKLTWKGASTGTRWTMAPGGLPSPPRCFSGHSWHPGVPESQVCGGNLLSARLLIL